jgi:hypothetical protein
MTALVGMALLSMTLGAGPSLLVVPANPASRGICEDLQEPFAATSSRVKLAGPRSEAVGCMAKRGTARVGCLADAEAKAKVESAVVVAATRRGGLLTVTLQLVGRGGELVHQETFRVARARLGPQARAALERGLAALRSSPTATARAAPAPVPKPEPEPEPEPELEPLTVAEAPAPRPVATDVPREAPPRGLDAPRAPAALQPSVGAQRPELTSAQPAPVTKRSNAAAWVVLGAAVVAAGVAGSFAGLGLSDRARLGTTTGGVSSLSYGQAVQLRDQANLELSVALGAGIGAAVLGSTAGVLWDR